MPAWCCQQMGGILAPSFATQQQWRLQSQGWGARRGRQVKNKNSKVVETPSEGQLGDKWKTLADNWKSNSGSCVKRFRETIWRPHLGTTGRQLGNHIWETTGRPHLGDRRKTVRQQAEKPWRQLRDNVSSSGWKTIVTQLGNKQKTTERQLGDEVPRFQDPAPRMGRRRSRDSAQWKT